MAKRITPWVLAGVLAAVLAAGSASAGETWPEHRGPTADGHGDAAGLPLQWSETENVAWKTAIHDRGWSSPVIWDGQIWLTTATEDGKRTFAVCVDRQTGRIVHDVPVYESRPALRLPAMRSSSPASWNGAFPSRSFATRAASTSTTAPTARPVWTPPRARSSGPDAI